MKVLINLVTLTPKKVNSNQKPQTRIHGFNSEISNVAVNSCNMNPSNNYVFFKTYKAKRAQVDHVSPLSRSRPSASPSCSCVTLLELKHQNISDLWLNLSTKITLDPG